MPIPLKFDGGFGDASFVTVAVGVSVAVTETVGVGGALISTKLLWSPLKVAYSPHSQQVVDGLSGFLTIQLLLLLFFPVTSALSPTKSAPMIS